MKKFSIEIRWGIMFSLFSMVWMIGEKAVGLHDAHINKQLLYTNLFGIVAIIIYTFALLDKKKNYYHGQMSFKQGFIAGAMLSLVIAVLSPLTQYIIYTYITPQYFSNMIAYFTEHKFKTREQAEALFSINSYILQGFSGTLCLQVITGALVAFAVQTKNNPNEK